MVYNVVRDAVTGCSNHANCIVGNENVGIGRLATSVDNHLIDTVSEDE